MSSSFLSQVETFNRNGLKSVQTNVTTADGKRFVEKCSEQNGVELVEELKTNGLGFCPDTTQDLTVGRAQERLLVGSQDVAHHLETLTGLGITHILNVAWGVPNAFTNDFTYLTVSMYDEPSEEVFSTHYSKCRRFIKETLDNGGTVLVHCNAGISRSSTVALAYMMESERIPLQLAYDRLKLSRPAIQPNPGFMEQLSHFQLELGIKQC